MSALPFKNVYHLRRVAESSQKPCMVCYKPTAVVLVSEDGKNDFFYTCQMHLQDRGFVTPVTNAAAEAAKKRKEELDKEIEKVKKEWEEHQKDRKAAREKREKQRKEEKATDKNKDEEDDKSADRREKQEHKEQMAKLENQKVDATTKADAEQRIFNLNKDVYAMRLNNYRSIQRSKRTAELLRKPGALPSVPTRDPSSTTKDTADD
ncbi:VPS4-associated protein 1 [Lipomyces kononenkoae]|uniref:VPS4-associated protein 1 n=1 Tax=Lipomyces kononenkoae TaxID=34357 RepID=A0ACC3T5Z9_LIPKO